MALTERLADMAIYSRVVETGSFSAAAEQLNLSKAAVSKAVSRLEGHLGVRLLNRTTRRLTPTEAGYAFQGYCQQVVASAEEAEQHLGQLRDVPRGTLKLTTPYTWGISRVAPLLPRFLARYPDIRVNLVLDDHNLDLVAGGFDLAMRLGAPPDSSLVARKLTDVYSVLVATPGYLERYGTPKTPCDLLRHNCLSFSELTQATRWWFEGPDGEETVTTSGQLWINASLGLYETVMAGIGIARMPSYLVAEDLAAGRLVRLLENYKTAPRPLYAVYPHRKHLATKVKAALEFFMEAFAETEHDLK